MGMLSQSLEIAHHFSQVLLDAGVYFICILAIVRRLFDKIEHPGRYLGTNFTLKVLNGANICRRTNSRFHRSMIGECLYIFSNEGVKAIILNQMLEIHQAIEEAKDLFNSFHNPKLIFCIEMARLFQRRHIGTRKFAIQRLTKPINILTFPYDCVFCKVCNKGDFELIFCPDSEKESSGFLHFPFLIADFWFIFELKNFGYLLAFLFNEHLIIPQPISIVEHLLFLLQTLHNLIRHGFFRCAMSDQVFLFSTNIFLNRSFKIGYYVFELSEGPVFQVNIVSCIAMKVPSYLMVPMYSIKASGSIADSRTYTLRNCCFYSIEASMNLKYNPYNQNKEKIE